MDACSILFFFAFLLFRFELENEQDTTVNTGPLTQSTHHVMLVRPASFGFNEETAQNNLFQTLDPSMDPAEISDQALREFEEFVSVLTFHGLDVTVIDDTPTPPKPDAVFPNNWFSTHHDGTLVTYPLFAESRRAERREDILKKLAARFVISRHVKLESEEQHSRFLEGTGSVVFDHQNRIALACHSPRTDEQVFRKLCYELAYRPVLFRASDPYHNPIYHTNVVMNVGHSYAIVCLEVIRDDSEVNALRYLFEQHGKEVVEISLSQMFSFAGNMLQVRNYKGESLIIASEQAYQSLTHTQLLQLEKHSRFVYADIDTIETYGGGGARCMVAEIFLPPK